LGHHEKNQAFYLDELKKLVRIPSVAFEGFDKQQVRRSGEATCDLLRRIGLDNVQLLEMPNAHPYAYGEWLKAPGRPTLLLYAHHDVQPAGDEEKWKTKPFEPTEKDGRLWGRGAADDKAGILVHVAAIDSWLKTAVALSKILARLVNDDGSIAIPGIYDKVKPLSEAEKKSITSLPSDEKLFRKQAGMLEGVQLLGGRHPWEMNWRQPSLAVNAIQASSRKDARNIIVESAWARIGIRTVPDMDPSDVEKRLVEALTRNPPFGVTVEVHKEGKASWWYTSTEAPAFKAAEKALREGYGKEPVSIGCGGSIPFVDPFSKELGGVPALLIGVEDPYSNA